jgi:hypothetical protein
MDHEPSAHRSTRSPKANALGRPNFVHARQLREPYLDPNRRLNHSAIAQGAQVPQSTMATGPAKKRSPSPFRWQYAATLLLVRAFYGIIGSRGRETIREGARAAGLSISIEHEDENRLQASIHPSQEHSCLASSTNSHQVVLPHKEMRREMGFPESCTAAERSPGSSPCSYFFAGPGVYS